jgi:hypothetical protein
MKMSRLVPRTISDWIDEIRLAIADAREARPFGSLIRGRITDANLFHTSMFVNPLPIGCKECFVGEVLALGVDLVLAAARGLTLGVVDESCHSVDIEQDVDSVIVGCFADVQDWVMVLLVNDDDADGVFGLVDDCAVGGDLKGGSEADLSRADVLHVFDTPFVG